MDILMATKSLISGVFVTMNVPKHLFMTIRFNLITIKIVLNEVERNTAINISLLFQVIIQINIKASLQTTNIYRLILDYSLSLVVLYFMHTYFILPKIPPHNNVINGITLIQFTLCDVMLCFLKGVSVRFTL